MTSKERTWDPRRLVGLDKIDVHTIEQDSLFEWYRRVVHAIVSIETMPRAKLKEKSRIGSTVFLTDSNDIKFVDVPKQMYIEARNLLAFEIADRDISPEREHYAGKTVT